MTGENLSLCHPEECQTESPTLPSRFYLASFGKTQPDKAYFAALFEGCQLLPSGTLRDYSWHSAAQSTPLSLKPTDGRHDT